MKSVSMLGSATVALASILLAVGAHVDAAGPANVKSTLQSMYDQENKAAGAKDPKGMLKYVSTSFVGIDAKGKKITYQDLTDSAQQVVGMATTVQAGTIVRTCKVMGNKAVARVDDEVRIVVAVPDQKATHVVDISSANDTWTKTKTGWRLTSTHTIKHKVTVDGQPADDENMGLPSF